MTQENNIPESKLIKSQKKSIPWKEFLDQGTKCRIRAEIRYDDEGGNGHNTFSITGETQTQSKNGIWRFCSGGCIHEDIAEHFPELAPFIKWHLVSSDYPMHYFANTIYHAGNRDYWGCVKGEPRHFEKVVYWDNVPIAHKYPLALIEFLESEPEHLEIIGFPHPRDTKTFGYNYTFRGLPEEWHKCPFSDEKEARELKQTYETCKMRVTKIPTSWGEGKERDFEAARASAVWPEATEEELSLPAEELRAKLKERLPALMQSFKEDVESLGFVY